MIRRGRPSPTVVLTGAVLVVLPVLAVLQYHWLSRIGEETSSRMRAMATSAALAMSADLVYEVRRACRERVDTEGAGTDRSDAARLVVDALVIDGLGDEAAPPRIRRWDLDARACEPGGWPDTFGLFPADSRHFSESLQRRSTALSIVPVELGGPGGARNPLRPPCEVSGDGLVVFRLDASALRASLVPEVARRHLAALQKDEFRVAIVSGHGAGEVIYAPAGTDAAGLVARPDVALPLTLASGERPGRGGRMRSGRDGPPLIAGRGSRADHDDGWLFLAQHHAGSLEEAVTRLRRRNLAISFGILLLMGVAVAMIGANARQAERLGKQQVEFVAAVSHEMRTPVTAIDLAARNLEDGLVADPARVQRYGGVIRAEVRRLADTVERVLQFAALEGGQSVSTCDRVDVRAVVDDVAARLRAGHPEMGVEVLVEGIAHTVMGETAVIRSMVENLTENAVKYGGTPPWVRIRLGGGDRPPQEVRVTVEDRGPGIDARDVPHVFEPFYRGRLATADRVKGSGLGLYIVKRSAEALGGRVSLETRRGPGTAITLSLPPAPPHTGDP